MTAWLLARLRLLDAALDLVGRSHVSPSRVAAASRRVPFPPSLVRAYTDRKDAREDARWSRLAATYPPF